MSFRPVALVALFASLLVLSPARADETFTYNGGQFNRFGIGFPPSSVAIYGSYLTGFVTLACAGAAVCPDGAYSAPSLVNPAGAGISSVGLTSVLPSGGVGLAPPDVYQADFTLAGGMITNWYLAMTGPSAQFPAVYSCHVGTCNEDGAVINTSTYAMGDNGQWSLGVPASQIGTGFWSLLILLPGLLFWMQLRVRRSNRPCDRC